MTRVLIDTSILCAAIYNDDADGLARAILHDALLGPRLAFDPVFSETVLMEFLVKCRQGIGKKRFNAPIQVKEAADIVAVTNDEDGAALVLEELFARRLC